MGPDSYDIIAIRPGHSTVVGSITLGYFVGILLQQYMHVAFLIDSTLAPTNQEGPSKLGCEIRTYLLLNTKWRVSDLGPTESNVEYSYLGSWRFPSA